MDPTKRYPLPEENDEKDKVETSEYFEDIDMDSDEEDLPSGSFEELFIHFANFRDDGATISLSSIEKWMTAANVMESYGITRDDITSIFSNVSKNKENKEQISMGEFNDFLKQLASEKNICVEELKDSMTKEAEGGATGLVKIVKDVVCNIWKRLTGSSAENSDEDIKDDDKGITSMYYEDDKTEDDDKDITSMYYEDGKTEDDDKDISSMHYDDDLTTDQDTEDDDAEEDDGEDDNGESDDDDDEDDDVAEYDASGDNKDSGENLDDVDDDDEDDEDNGSDEHLNTIDPTKADY